MNKFTEITLLSAAIGQPNPMPDIKNIGYIHAGFEVKPSLSADERKYLGKGMISTLIPYMIQDNYDRNKKPVAYKAAVLENENLKAIFLPEFGGRLWSLYDKKHKKDLLYTNSVLQPCNFALRNAWFSGGVEFNIGIKGHSPLTCSPMFTELIGNDAIRFYEYERIRGLVYSVTAYLPEKSETLYIRTRVENTSDCEKYMYWWSNIAFPEKNTTRVIVPAHDAIHCLYQEDHYVVDKESIPVSGNVDVTYSMNMGPSSDYFYKIPKESEKWIAAVDPDGAGLLQYSDSPLKGRKLFLWGKNVGGRHWNEFLSQKGEAYIEIQAGLMNTQLEHKPMPAHTVWEWTEGYTYIDGTDKDFYGDWDKAIDSVKKYFAALVARKGGASPAEIGKLEITGNVKKVFDGSGWGTLENKVRKLRNELPISDSLSFEKETDIECKDFNDLLDKGFISYRSVNEVPVSYINGKFWLDKLLKSTELKEGDHWYTYLQAGITAYALGEVMEARRLFEISIEREPSLWAYRNLAMIYLNEIGDKSKGLIYMAKAYEMPIAKELYSFLKEYGYILINNNCDKLWIKIYELLPEYFRKNSRLAIYYAFALLHIGKPEDTAKIITKDFVLNDVKEGELSVSKLWQDTYMQICKKKGNLSDEAAKKLAAEKYPLPYALDFRMHD